MAALREPVDLVGRLNEHRGELSSARTVELGAIVVCCVHRD
jgi:hypothetical protein